MTAGPLLPLLHLCDSLFPTGAFAHSDGLEWAVDCGRVASPADLGAWMDACLDQVLARCDGPGVCLAAQAFAARDWEGLKVLNAELRALRPSAAAREASRAMGARLVRTWRELYRPPALDELFACVEVAAMTLPAGFGVACAAAGIEARAAVQAFAYTRLASTASAAMRLMPIGQQEAHRLLAARLPRAAALADAIAAAPPRPGAFAPALDIAAMAHQHVRSRLFKS